MLITRAAIMFSDGEILEGYDYGKINSLSNRLGVQGDKVYGFVTSSDDFVLPDEAAKIAVEAGQLDKKVDNLRPEDLWSEYVAE